jgi:methionyl-tRNA synthetase
MSENILVAVAWPYASSQIHVGNITGSYLPADIFARYQRLKGRRVLMVSGSDSHGTPVTVAADAEGKDILQVYQQYHHGFLELFQKLGLSYDLFTSTHTQNHFKVSQTLFLALNENGYLYTDIQPQWYSPVQKRFLPDRYVEGTCAVCGFVGARSDQCDNCGTLLEPEQLLEPRSKIDGSTPELRDSEHFYLDFSKLQPQILEFLRQRQDYWRSNVLRQSLGQIEADGLRGRPITRDLDWGIPVPIDGWDGKCIYVWFEAVIGYLSAAIEWAQLNGQKDAWHEWWTNAEAKTYYFIGKDNIPFHAVFWPGELIGAEDTFVRLFEEREREWLTLPYDVPANEFMNLEGRRISGSRNWAVWGLDFLERYDPDPLRFYLTANMPESRDSEWDWEEFLSRNNNELVANWGNLANRVLTFAHRNWDGMVPDPGDLRPEDEAILAVAEAGFESVGAQIEAVRLRAGLNEALRIAGEVNKYLDTAAPWFEIKEDKEQAAKSVYTALRAIDSLKVLLAPVLPHSSEKLHTLLGYSGTLFGEAYTQQVIDDLGTHTVLRYRQGKASGHWQASELSPGQKLLEPQPLFKKLEPDMVAKERERLGIPST